MAFFNSYAYRPAFALRAAALMLAAAAGAVAATQAAPAKGTLASCLDAVVSAKGAEISCEYEVLLTETERADMRRITRDLLQDATCTVDIRIARALVKEALKKPDHTFEAPPQPVRCEIKTKDGGFPITSTFSPRVVFKDGKAIEGTPGLGEVTGINRYLAWPVVAYVNRADGIEREMLAIINAIRPKLAAALEK